MGELNVFVAPGRLALLVVVCLAVGLVPGGCSSGTEASPTSATTPSAPTSYTYRVIDAFPHDTEAFTQGLAYDSGVLYEGTGLHGQSSLRRVHLETGAVLQSVSVPDHHFAEGITICEDSIIQLTWKSRIGFVYDKHDLRIVREFSYNTEGWGITYDGERLIMSDGSPRLYFLDPDTYKVDYYVTVMDHRTEVTGLNELEYVKGRVFANVWRTDRLAIIDPADGRVTGWLDLSGLLDARPVSGHVDVLNGIAWDPAGDRLFVTGKLWPWLFEIRMVRD